MYVGYNQRDIYDDTEGGRAIKDPAVRIALAVRGRRADDLPDAALL